MFKSNLKNTKNKTAKRSMYVLIAFLLFASFLLVNIFKLDVLLYEHYRDKAFDQITTTSSIKAERGKIYDRYMNILSTNKTCWRVFISPKALKERVNTDGEAVIDNLTEGLASIFGLDKNELKEKISNANTLDLTIKRDINEEEYERVLSLISEKTLDGILFTEAQTERVYPEGTLAAHVLGFTGSDNQGLYGLEYSYNDILTGTDGYYLYAKDAGGNALPGEYADYVEPVDGNSIITTIDTYIQNELESIIELIREKHSVTNRVTGIVMDSGTGAILGMATSSPFDPNDPFTLDDVSMSMLLASGYEEGSDEYTAYKRQLMEVMWSNKAVSEIYEPGSTFKIVTVSSAIDSGAASMSDTFSCCGYLSVGGWRIKCHKRQGHGSGFDLAYGLQNSCNPTMMTIAERMGSQTFYEYIKAFGYLEKTGIDLPSEASGIFHKAENIGSTELATISFGQRFKVSIIAQLTAVAAVANGGLLVEPYLVERIIDSEGNIVNEHETVVKRRVISEQTAKEVSIALEAGVSGDGGAKNAYVFGYEVAAKTGTSEKFDILDENGNSYLRIASTVAYAPINDSGIVAIIVVDEPQSQVKYGSTVAAPYISALFENILPYLDYPANEEKPTTPLKNFVGMNINTAAKELKTLGIECVVVGNGQVVLGQTPNANIDIYPLTSVVYLYTSPEEKPQALVPQMTGKTLCEAMALAKENGISLEIDGVFDLNYSDRLIIVSQSRAANEIVSCGDIIRVCAQLVDHED